MTKRFRSLANKGQKARHHPLLAIDVENDPKTGDFICAGLVGESRNHHGKTKGIELYFDDIRELEAYLNRPIGKNHPFIIVGFNLGYDYYFLREFTDDSKLLFARGSFISGRLKNGIKMIDLSNHVERGQSLEDWIGYLEMEAKFGLKKETLDDPRLRVMSDARATWLLGRFLEDFYFHECNSSLKLTVGANALDIFARNYFTDYWHRSGRAEELNDFERNAYYGGRVETYQRGLHSYESYDVNSMYLSIMHDMNIPDPITANYVQNGDTWGSHLYDFDGVYDVTITVPESYVMVLPYRLPENDKLLFPWGRWRATYTAIELRMALTRGYKIEKCHAYIWYRQSKPYFREFAEFIWKKRQEYKALGNVGMDKQIKKIGNTLYGKFAQAIDIWGYHGKLSDYDGGFSPDWIVTNIDGIEWLTIASNGRKDSKHTFPIISVYIASYARLKLLRALIANEKRLIYCDTDSIKVRLDRSQKIKGIAIGDGLGSWSFDGYGLTTFFRAKFYGDICKGVPKRAKMIIDTETYRIMEYETPVRYIDGLRRGIRPCTWHTVQKTLTKGDDKRLWKGDKSAPIEIIDVC